MTAAHLYYDDLIEDASTLVRCYDRSVGFYQELVADEGHEEFRSKLAQTIAGREAARRRHSRGRQREVAEPESPGWLLR